MAGESSDSPAFAIPSCQAFAPAFGGTEPAHGPSSPWTRQEANTAFRFLKTA